MSHPEPVAAELLEFETFEPLIGTSFDVTSDENGDASATLKLKSAELLGEKNPFGRRPFSLIFEGKPEQEIPQSSFWFKSPQLGSQLIFIVPIGADQNSRRYEAVFN